MKKKGKKKHLVAIICDLHRQKCVLPTFLSTYFRCLVLFIICLFLYLIRIILLDMRAFEIP